MNISFVNSDETDSKNVPFSPLITLAAVGVAAACEPGGGGTSGGSCSAANRFIVDPNLCDPTEVKNLASLHFLYKMSWLGFHPQAENVYAFRAKDIDGNMVDLDKYRGHVMVVVNVASE